MHRTHINRRICANYKLSPFNYYLLKLSEQRIYVFWMGQYVMSKFQSILQIDGHLIIPLQHNVNIIDLTLY